jgi:peptidoglycan hydrolase-like protein with peptidoglycan-binding domain
MSKIKSAFFLLLMVLGMGIFSQSQSFTREISLTNPRMNGEDIVEVQQRLADLGFSEVGGADGWFGPNSEAAIINFQKKFALMEDGVVTQNIWTMLSHTNISLINNTIDQVASIENSNLHETWFRYQIVYEEGPGHPIGYEVTVSDDPHKDIKKISTRIVGDLSGYIYTAYYNQEELIMLSNLYWGFDTHSDEFETRWITNYYFQNGNFIAEQNPLSFEWEIGTESIDRYAQDEIERIKRVITESLMRYENL